VHYARSAAKSGKIRYNPDTFGITVLTTISSIHELSTTSYNGSYISKAMKPIYEDAAKIKNRGAPLKRAEFTEQKVTKRNGVWLSVHNSIDTASTSSSPSARTPSRRRSSSFSKAFTETSYSSAMAPRRRRKGQGSGSHSENPAQGEFGCCQGYD
jgi:hypothetical protein